MVAKARRLLATDTHTTHAAHDLHRDPSGQLGHVAAVAKTCPPVFPTFRDFGLHWFTRAQETQNELQKGHFIREGEGGGRNESKRVIHLHSLRVRAPNDRPLFLFLVVMMMMKLIATCQSWSWHVRTLNEDDGGGFLVASAGVSTKWSSFRGIFI
ncbi:hypothetical protein POX_c03990 [Penicillium oxalicum]|uniref:hypothetical protein n=1 Tax=Penicillium oxalicum TaxID=69781 RepID=UPI0020B6CBCB|nr:hypothetical protein POX_c03990 [Penicillium oxalicum]KAI2791134.1 hypothetical protein POX_c03990 [Penicillium oxalicum]